MSHVYVTSDWHIGHSGISNKFRRQYQNDLEHDYDILTKVTETVRKRDVLFVLGDATWTQKGLKTIDSMKIPCPMYLVRGNHDILPTTDYLAVFKEVYGAYHYKKCWFTHIPIHPNELMGRKNIHGHCHRGGPNQLQTKPDWFEYYNAILEYNDYRPINMQVVYEQLQKQWKTANERKTRTVKLSKKQESIQ